MSISLGAKLARHAIAHDADDARWHHETFFTVMHALCSMLRRFPRGGDPVELRGVGARLGSAPLPDTQETPRGLQA